MNFKADRYQKMQYRNCGKWGLKLPIISLGGWQTVGGYEKGGEAANIFFEAFDLGITHFDFANNYGTPLGNSEIEGGKILKNLPRDEIVVSSKAGYYMWDGPYGEWGSKKHILASCDQSLKRMGFDYFDIFYHHRPDPDTPLEETFSALETIVRQGKALYVGVSNYPPELMDEAIKLINKKDWNNIIIHQPRYNMFDRVIEDGLIQNAEKNNYGIITFSPLAQGLLSNKYLNGIPKDSRLVRLAELPENVRKHKGNLNSIDEEKIGKVKLLNEVAKNRNQSLSQMALAWILRWKQVTSVLTAVSNTTQLEDTIKTLDNLDFSKEELSKIEGILK